MKSGEDIILKILNLLGEFDTKFCSGLDFSAGNGKTLVVVSQAGGLGSDSLKGVIDERVHDGFAPTE